MKFPLRKIAFPCILALVVFAALVLTTPAYAEGEAPAADAPPVETRAAEPAPVEPAAAGPADDSPAELVEAEALETLPVEAETAAQPLVQPFNPFTQFL